MHRLAALHATQEKVLSSKLQATKQTWCCIISKMCFLQRLTMHKRGLRKLGLRKYNFLSSEQHRNEWRLVSNNLNVNFNMAVRFDQQQRASGKICYILKCVIPHLYKSIQPALRLSKLFMMGHAGNTHISPCSLSLRQRGPFF